MKSYSLLFAVIVCWLSIYSQEEVRFVDFIVHDNSIWTLDSEGRVHSYELNDSLNPLEYVEVMDNVVYMTTDRYSSPILVQKSGESYSYRSISEKSLFTSNMEPIYDLIFNSKNECFLISPEGIKKLDSKKFVFPKDWSNRQINYNRKWFRNPEVYIDGKDRIWVGFAYGEWGGELFIFDTKNNKYELPEYGDFRITLNPVKSIFGANDKVYATFGLMHFDASGTIVRFNDLSCELILESEPKGIAIFEDSLNPYIPAEYIGPGGYFHKTNSIFFYSQNGFFRAVDNQDLNDINKWTNIVKPRLHWKGGQPDAVGSPMNVVKFKLLNEEQFVFLTQLDGIGYFNGKSISYLKDCR